MARVKLDRLWAGRYRWGLDWNISKIGPSWWVKYRSRPSWGPFDNLHEVRTYLTQVGAKSHV